MRQPRWTEGEKRLLRAARRRRWHEYTVGNTTMDQWFERDRAHVCLNDVDNGDGIIEWWDAEVGQAQEDGFLSRDSRKWHKDLCDYANERKLIPMPSFWWEWARKVAAEEPFPPRQGEILEGRGKRRRLIPKGWKRCPRCRKPVHDVATVDQRLNKCWSCGWRWMGGTMGSARGARVWSYDVWGNAEDGWEVNDRSEVGSIPGLRKIPESDARVLRLMKDHGLLRQEVKLSEVELDGDDMSVSVSDAATGEPLGEIVMD